MITKEYVEPTKLDILVNRSRDMEEVFLSFIEDVENELNTGEEFKWLRIAKTHIQEGSMAIRKAIFSGSTTLDKRPTEVIRRVEEVFDVDEKEIFSQ